VNDVLQLIAFNILQKYDRIMTRLLYFVTLLVLCLQTAIAGTCPDWLNQSVKKLHSQQTVNLCELTAGKPVMVVNTASHCGYTPQFSGLEKLHQQYKAKGLVVLGFASNDFDQEADNEKAIADVCYLNYGVTFTMLAPVHVKGEQALSLFKHLAQATQEPAWNFNKYLIDAKGQVVNHFASDVIPEAPEMQQAIEAVLRQ
jgi:glutathione peroxidase